MKKNKFLIDYIFLNNHPDNKWFEPKEISAQINSENFLYVIQMKKQKVRDVDI